MVQLNKIRELNITADELINKLVGCNDVCLLDSCGVKHLGSHLLIAGISPIEKLEITRDNPFETLKFLNDKLANPTYASIFTLSYDFGLKLENITSRHTSNEPDLFIATFEVLIIHDYDTKKTFLCGNKNKFDEVENLLNSTDSINSTDSKNSINSTDSKTYVKSIEKIQDLIREGKTYQTNLTRQIKVNWEENPNVGEIFLRLRKENPAPFAAFLKRDNDTVISASPERFLRVENGIISTSPIKGTRPRGNNQAEDLRLREELLSSEKDIAENVMIVDLLRNDLGRVCEFGSVKVEKLCDLETHPTLFHLVSTVCGKLKRDVSIADVIQAVFPCGSITGCPKISTMRIIDEIEPTSRGLSMGTIGVSIPNFGFQIPNSPNQGFMLDMSVAIRTMVVRRNVGAFNVGGGIVIDSVPHDEFVETEIKSMSLLDAVNFGNGKHNLIT
jgi:para-aminobenzoate synthetase component I